MRPMRGRTGTSYWSIGALPGAIAACGAGLALAALALMPLGGTAGASGSGLLTQSSATSVSVLQGSGYSGSVTVTGAVGTVTYTESPSADALDISITPQGLLTVPTYLTNGVYTVTGTATDSATPSADTGTWTFTVTVGLLSQAAPMSASTPTGAGYSGQLEVVTSNGILTFTETTSADSTDVAVSAVGVISAGATLTPGTYTVSGTDKDSNGDAGKWTFALTVGGSLQQVAPLSGSVATDTAYNGQLAMGNPSGSVTYTETTSTYSTNVVVSSSGAISYTPGATPLAVGTYTVSGAAVDASNDTGAWTFTLSVGATLSQTSPVSATVPDGAGYAGQLQATNAADSQGTLTYTEAPLDATDVVVNATGAISAATTLGQGTYTVSGSETDGMGNFGTWSFSLTVTLEQQAPFSAIVLSEAGYSGQLNVAGATGKLTFTESQVGDYKNVVVSSTGAISASAALGSASYTVSGTDADASNDTGTWTFTLVVSNGLLTQTSPTTATVADGTAYSGQLAVSGGDGTVTYSETASLTAGQVVVTPSGGVTSLATLAPGTYAVDGTDVDTGDDDGTWAFTLTVSPATTTPPPMSGGAYDLVGSDGGVFVFGNSNGFYGSLPGMHIRVSNIVGIEPTADDLGYFLVGSDGGVFTFGDANFEQSLPGLGVKVNDIVGIVPTADDKGYFLVGRDGGVFAFGDAPFEDSLPGENIHVHNIVGIATTSDDLGYWLVSSSGTVYDLGDAAQIGSTATSSVVSITATPSGTGYWVTSANGTVANFGKAVNAGSLPSKGVNVTDIVSLVPSITGNGYLLVGRDGGLFAFGDATFPGSLPGDGVVVDDIVGAVPTG
jgi:hypothetical protein